MAELFTRQEASAYLHVSLRFFQANIRPVLARVEAEGIVRYEREVLDRWVDEHRVGGLGGAKKDTGRSGGPRKGTARKSPPDAETAEIEQRLRLGLERSTRSTSAKAPTANNVVPFPSRRCSGA